MDSWKVEFHRGCRDLKRHRERDAVQRFKTAINELQNHVVRSVSNSGRLRNDEARAFHYLALALYRLGTRNRALAAWVEAARLLKRGRFRRRVDALVNEYGMAAQENQDLDHRHAFYGVHLARYIRSKKSHRLGTRAEVDMVVELIQEHWNRVSGELDLEKLDADGRLEAFRSTMIVFPFLSVPDALKTEDVAVDFCNGTRVTSRNRCVCGSGLEYRICHGRTPGIDEVLTGSF